MVNSYNNQSGPLSTPVYFIVVYPLAYAVQGMKWFQNNNMPVIAGNWSLVSGNGTAVGSIYKFVIPAGACTKPHTSQSGEILIEGSAQGFYTTNDWQVMGYTVQC
jgi:hypothetical protein